ncbi:hypothetical protein NYF14_10600 [Sphingobium sp. 10 DY56-G10]|uniref:hypothetical protein n=1 Tax=Sphingobium sp. 10 DY56-G10 TaxID=2974918 RepID=UPI00352A40CC
MAQPRVAIRLGTEGKDQVVRDFKAVGDAGDAAANRAARAFDRASQDIESAVRRQAAAADKLAALAPQSAMQARINMSVGTGASLDEGSARASAAAFRELIAEQERMEQKALALRASLDPLWAAQQRFNMEMAEARTLISAGAISLDEYVAKLRMEQAALDAVQNVQVRATATSGAMRAGMQQLGFQAQDFTVQVIGGTDAVRAFAMQAPQAIGALQLMSGGAEGGAGKFARFASILAGPVGVAIGVAIPLAVMLGEKFFAAGDDAESASKKVDTLTAALNRLANAQGRVQANDLGMGKVKVEQLRGQLRTLDQEIANSTGTRAAMQRRRQLERERAGLANELGSAEATVAGAQIAWDNRIKLDALGQQDRAAAAAGRSAASAARKAEREREREAERIAREEAQRAQRVRTENNGWLNQQDIGAGARSALDADGEKLADRQRLIRSMNDDISAGTALLNIEWEMRGKSRREIEAAVELKRYEIDLQQQGIDLASAEGQQLMARKASQIGFNQALDQSIDKMTAMQDIGVNLANTLLNPATWTSWKNVGLSAINEVTSALWKLAIVNPIQNQLTGGSLPTIGSLFGLLGKKSVPGSAIGHDYTPAGAMLVGENGPEIVQMPRGAKVMTASDTRRAMASGGPVEVAVRVIKGDMFDVEVTQISGAQIAQAAPVIAAGASSGAQRAVYRRNSRRLA